MNFSIFVIQDDLHERGKISQILNRIANYQGGVEPNISENYQSSPKKVHHTELQMFVDAADKK